MKKCMEFRVGRPRRTWLKNVEADIVELEIDKEDVHDRKKCKRNVMKRKFNPIGCIVYNFSFTTIYFQQVSITE